MQGLQRSVFPWVHGHKLNLGQKPHATISSQEIAKDYGCPASTFNKYVEQEIAEAQACQSLPFTLLLVASYAIMAIAHDDAVTIRGVEDSIEFDISENANFAYTGDYAGHKTIMDVNSYADFWSWMNEGFLPLLFQQSNSFHEGYNASDLRFQAASVDVKPRDRGFILNYNRVIGGMRLVQERTDPARCTTYAGLLRLYNQDCVSGTDYNLEPEVGLPAEQAQTTTDPVYERWLYVFDDYDSLKLQLTTWETERWLDRSTKKIEIGIPLYNAEFGLHTLVFVDFYFSRGGHIWKKIIPQSQFADWHDQWYYGFYDAIWLLCLFYIFVVEIIEIQALVRTKGCFSLFTEYVDIWNLIDWASVFGGLMIVIVFWASISNRLVLNAHMIELGALDPITARADYTSAVSEYFKSLQANVNYVRILKLLLAGYPLLIVFRLFKSFSAQPRLALVTRTIYMAASDLFHFMVVFTSVFFTFTICGIVLFGREVGSFTTIPRAFVSCFRLMMGDIDWEEISTIGRPEAGIWLWLFITIVVLLMLNMILAIIMDNYGEVKAQTGNAETLLDEAVQTWQRYRGVRSGKLISLDVIKQAMHRERRRKEIARRVSGHLPKGGNLSHMPGLASFSKMFSGITEMMQTADMGDLEDDTADMGDETAYGEDDYLVTMDSLRAAVSHVSEYIKMNEEQALEILQAAVEDFYEEHKQGVELEEVLKITQKVNARVKKLINLTRGLHEVQGVGPLEELKWFGTELDSYLMQVREERATQALQVERLKQHRKELHTKLIRISPEEVFKDREVLTASLVDGSDGSDARERVLRDFETRRASMTSRASGLASRASGPWHLEEEDLPDLDSDFGGGEDRCPCGNEHVTNVDFCRVCGRKRVHRQDFILDQLGHDVETHDTVGRSVWAARRRYEEVQELRQQSAAVGVLGSATGATGPAATTRSSRGVVHDHGAGLGALLDDVDNPVAEGLQGTHDKSKPPPARGRIRRGATYGQYAIPE